MNALRFKTTKTKKEQYLWRRQSNVCVCEGYQRDGSIINTTEQLNERTSHNPIKLHYSSEAAPVLIALTRISRRHINQPDSKSAPNTPHSKLLIRTHCIVSANNTLRSTQPKHARFMPHICIWQQDKTFTVLHQDGNYINKTFTHVYGLFYVFTPL